MHAAESAFQWLQQHYVELIAVITGLLYVILAVLENPLLWLFGIISSGLYALIFYQSGIYAYAALYVFYVIIGLYGWYNWSDKTDKTHARRQLTVRWASKGTLWLCTIITLTLAVPIAYALQRFTSSGLVIADAFLTAGGIVATWMLTQKYIEQWLFWIIIDMSSMGLMMFKKLYPSALLFFIYTLLAIKGFAEWKKEYKIQQVK